MSQQVITRDGISLSLPDSASHSEIDSAFAATLALMQQEQIAAAIDAAIQRATTKGQSIIRNFATENVLLGLSVEQIAGLLQLLAPVKALLESGALPTAATYLRGIEARPDLGLPADRLERFIQQIEA